jgi:hypothetical protein
VVELPFAADCCPCVEKLRTVLPFTVVRRVPRVRAESSLPACAHVSLALRLRQGDARGARRAVSRSSLAPLMSLDLRGVDLTDGEHRGGGVAECGCGGGRSVGGVSGAHRWVQVRGSTLGFVP